MLRSSEMMTDSSSLFLVICGAVVIIILLIYLGNKIWHHIFDSPFDYPYFVWEFDVSGKRSVKIENEVDRFLCHNGMELIDNHIQEREQWEKECEDKINASVLKKLRRKQFEQILDDDHMFVFRLVRGVTKYKQTRYVKESYKEKVVQKRYFLPYKTLYARFKKLQQINFECTLEEYNAKDQRKLLTSQLREEIKERDNYTCQICGKYMPDEIGLQISYITPISKGGKTVLSNLQVLCNKCNMSKRRK